jgi:HlyD family secretion protein
VASPVFRKVSLERLSSPEQLDQMMRVTDAKGWIVQVAFGVVLLIAIVWGAYGSVPHTVAGTGILVRSGGVFEVIALSTGRITDVSVGVGDIVSEGQVVAHMTNPEVAEQLREAGAILTALKVEHERIAAYGTEEDALQARLLNQEQESIEQAIAAAERSIAWYDEKIAAQEALVKEGLLTREALVDTYREIDAAKQQISDNRSRLRLIPVKNLELRNKREQAVNLNRTKIDAQARSVAELERRVKARSEIVARQTGRILEVLTEQGAVVNQGEPVLTLDLLGRTVKELEAVIYVPSAQGKQIKVDMSVMLAPSTVKREEYGMLVARVTSVSEFPATSRSMMRILKNDKLVASLAGNDAPYEIRADLLIDERTASKYRWSSSQGPPLRIQSGTVAVAQISVATRRPIDMVFPLIRQHAGL